MRWLARIALFCAIAVSAFAPVPQAEAQTTDPNAPYKGAYDVQTRGKLFGKWHGAISGARFPKTMEKCLVRRSS